MSTSAPCPWCSAQRAPGPTCPHCGADYAKAAAIRTHGRATPAESAHAAPSPAERTGPELLVHAQDTPELNPVSDSQLEYRFCLAAIPLALCCALLFKITGLGASLQRIFLTMPVHELGHAVTAWLCGFSAVPTLWKTLIPETRGFIAPILLTCSTSYMMYRAWQKQGRAILFAGAVLLALQFIGTVVVTPATAQMLIIFGGDGAGMILATALMASFFFGKRTQIYKGALRWGFVIIGAAAFVDMFATWWKSRRDESAIPYGTMDGMASDAMKLVEDYGWSLQTLVSRYVTLGVCCLIALALVYAWGVLRARRKLMMRRAAERREAWAKRRVDT